MENLPCLDDLFKQIKNTYRTVSTNISLKLTNINSIQISMEYRMDKFCFWFVKFLYFLFHFSFGKKLLKRL